MEINVKGTILLKLGVRSQVIKIKKVMVGFLEKWGDCYMFKEGGKTSRRKKFIYTGENKRFNTDTND